MQSVHISVGLISLLGLVSTARATIGGIATECKFRELTYNYSLLQIPDRAPLLEVFDALELNTYCGLERPAEPKTKPQGDWPPIYPTPPGTTSNNIFVDPVRGSDITGSGSIEAPFKTLSRAVEASRVPGSLPSTLLLRAGLHTLNDSLILGPKDSGLSIQNYEGEEAWVSGGTPLDIESWSRYNDSTIPEQQQANIWVTDLSQSARNPTSMVGLFQVDPHVRFMRARWPNPPAGTSEIRPVSKVAPLSFLPPDRVLPEARQILVNATVMSGFDSSTMIQYNSYGNGLCAFHGDPDCPCGQWSDVRDGEWSSDSYWCSSNAAGGWAFMDRGNTYYNGPTLPIGLKYNTTRGVDPDKDLSRFQRYANASGAIVVAWRA